jgi:uncharacterized membrane protein YhiD involved in acid resistance
MHEKGLPRRIATGVGQVPAAVLMTLVTFAALELAEHGVVSAADLARAQEARLIRTDPHARESDVVSEALAAQARALSLPHEVVDSCSSSAGGSSA